MIFLSNNLWQVNTTDKKGRGIFAKKDILPGTIIGDYIGVILHSFDEKTLELDSGNKLFLAYYHDHASIYPNDINSAGVHLINHSCTPNCWMYIYHGHILFFALRHIFPGEELTISYLLPPKTKFCNPCPHSCYCESINCIGSMHTEKEYFEKWQQFRKIQIKKTKRARVRYDKLLPLLSSYPQKISDNQIYPLFGSNIKAPLKFDNNTIPNVIRLRKIIRQTGKILEFTKLKTIVLGVKDKVIVLQK